MSLQWFLKYILLLIQIPAIGVNATLSCAIYTILYDEIWNMSLINVYLNYIANMLTFYTLLSHEKFMFNNYIFITEKYQFTNIKMTITV